MMDCGRGLRRRVSEADHAAMDCIPDNRFLGIASRRKPQMHKCISASHNRNTRDAGTMFR
jgi:hypothetical protein